MYIPEDLGKHVVIKDYMDSNHAGNMANRRSYYGIIIYVNNAPILWYIKFQNAVEASSFGLEFFVLWIDKEMIEALRYRCSCFGVPVEGPAEIFCDKK